jgi:rubrerythrin
MNCAPLEYESNRCIKGHDERFVVLTASLYGLISWILQHKNWHFSFISFISPSRSSSYYNQQNNPTSSIKHLSIESPSRTSFSTVTGQHSITRVVERFRPSRPNHQSLSHPSLHHSNYSHRILFLTRKSYLQILPMATPSVPRDTWQCGGCKGYNLIATAPYKCPVCEHERDYDGTCCKGPGEPLQSSGLFPEYPEYPSHESYGSTYYAYCSYSNPIGRHTHNAMSQPIHTTLGYELWHCNECGADNPDWHTDQCPVCGAGKAASMQYSASMEITTSDGAGSAAEGVWICQWCGSSNASFHWPQCGACGETQT